MEIMASSRRWDSTLEALNVEIPPRIWWCFRENGLLEGWEGQSVTYGGHHPAHISFEV